MNNVLKTQYIEKKNFQFSASKSSTKKVPNFAEIHKKNFSKMESLVDLKKRIEERHVTLNAPTSSTKKSNNKGNIIYYYFNFT